VYALDRATGAVRWKALTGGRVRSSPAVADGRVFVGSMDGVLYALDLTTGAGVWRFETQGTTLFSGDFGYDRRTIQSSPAVLDGLVVVGTRDGTMYALDAATGRERWRVSHGMSWINTSPAIHHGVVYAGSSDARFVQAVDAASGAERWRSGTPGVVWSSPAVAGDLVLAGDGAGWLHALDRATGAARWTFRAGAGIHGSPVVAGGLVLVGSLDGTLYALRTGPEPAIRRAVFFDSTLVRAAWHGESERLARFLETRGYAVLAAPGLAAFVDERIRDRAPSVVVFAIDHLPPPLGGNGRSPAPLRRYLEAGGKVVWPGMPPLLWPRDPGTGRPNGGLESIVWDGPAQLLGVDHQRALFDLRGVRITPAGRRWGLTGRPRLAWGVAPAGVTEVLAEDEWGLAAAWVRSYGGPPGTGFVRLGEPDPMTVYLVAEHRPSSQ
jgi:hypothetical protein